jgi:hypothetical protein
MGGQHRAELTPMGLVDEIDEALNAVPEQAKAEVRAQYRWLVVAAAVVSLIVSVPTSLIAIDRATGAQARTEAAQASQVERDASVDTALQRLREANSDLEARGQAPVAVPSDPSDAIAAAVTARVLASIPPTPTAAQVGVAISSAVTANLLGPSREALTDLVASYFATNPPKPGPAPTQGQIQAAVDRAYAANPPAQGPKGDKGDPCLPSDPACIGPKGDPGVRGDPGADSTVPGPIGPPVAAWSWPDPIAPDVTHTCTRTGGPDDAPTYTCT